jgi:hypothetical protein
MKSQEQMQRRTENKQINESGHGRKKRALLCYALLCTLHSRCQVNGPSPTGRGSALANQVP